MNSIDWDCYFMSMCDFISMRSKDKATHFGCVIVDSNRRILSTGYNSFPTGINDDVEDRQVRPKKYFYFAHAEENAIANAARNGIKLLSSILYVNGPPCSTCARLIINAGIWKVVMDKRGCEALTGKCFDDLGESDWDDNHRATLEMFAEAGIEIEYYDGEIINNIETMIRGKDFRNG